MKERISEIQMVWSTGRFVEAGSKEKSINRKVRKGFPQRSQGVIYQICVLCVPSRRSFL